MLQWILSRCLPVKLYSLKCGYESITVTIGNFHPRLGYSQLAINSFRVDFRLVQLQVEVPRFQPGQFQRKRLQESKYRRFRWLNLLACGNGLCVTADY